MASWAASQSDIIVKSGAERNPLGAAFQLRSRQLILAWAAVRVVQVSAVEYGQFIVKAFEQRPGKWRARVKRCDGKPLMVAGNKRVKIEEFVTGQDSSTPQDALRSAIDAIDAGAFIRCR
jgi:hypothetical protein